MADFKNINDRIDEEITENGHGDITGLVLNSLLKAILAAVNAAKVDTESGKGLSTNDFTTDLANKLTGLINIRTTDYDADNDRITIGGKTYQLTEYVPIPDFYAFFGNVKYTEGAWNFQTNGGSWKTFYALTAEDLMAVATAQGEGGGNMIKTTAQKITLPTKNHGSVKCDYVKNDYNGGGNALLILSKANVTLDFTIITSALESHYIYNRSQSVDGFNHNMDKSNLEIGTGKYNLRVYKATSGTLDGNSFGINYNN